MFFQGYTLSQRAHANILLANTTYAIVSKLTWPLACRVSASYTGTEPYVFPGAAPYMTQFDGTVPATAIPSFSLDVPNLAFVNASPVSYFDIIGDQTAGTVVNIAAQFGLQMVWNPEYLFYNRLIGGRNIGSNNVVSTFDGKTYSTTPDGLPIFSDVHPSYNAGGVQSNIIRGNCPGTPTAVATAGIASVAQSIWNDLQAITATIQKWRNTNGAPLFPTADPAENLVLIMPPDLGIAASLALRYRGLVNATTNIAPDLHKNVIINGLCAGVPQITSAQGPSSVKINHGVYLTPPLYPSTSAPQLEYYVLVTGWTTGAAYMQIFNPLAMNQTFPGNYDPVKQIDQIVKETGIDQKIATTMAMSLVQTNFKAMGTESDPQAMLTKQYLVAGTQIINCFFPWPGLIYRVIPLGGVV